MIRKIKDPIFGFYLGTSEIETYVVEEKEIEVEVKTIKYRAVRRRVDVPREILRKGHDETREWAKLCKYIPSDTICEFSTEKELIDYCSKHLSDMLKYPLKFAERLMVDCVTLEKNYYNENNHLFDSEILDEFVNTGIVSGKNGNQKKLVFGKFCYAIADKLHDKVVDDEVEEMLIKLDKMREKFKTEREPDLTEHTEEKVKHKSNENANDNGENDRD